MRKLEEITSQALKEMNALGAQQCSAQAYESESRELNVEGGAFSLYRTTLDNSLSLQATKSHRRGTVSGNSFDMEDIKSAARDCVSSADAGQPDDAWDMAKQGQGDFEDGAFAPDMDQLFSRSRELLDTIKASYPKIIVEQMIVSHTAARGIYQNSNGVLYRRKTGQYSAQLMFSGHEGDKSSSFNGAGVVTDSLDVPFIELGSIRDNLRDAQNQIHTISPEGKYEGTVVFTPDCLGSLLYELLSNYASDSVLLDGTSQWKNKLNMQVADKRITLSMSPLDSRVAGGERYTPEGFLSQNYHLIEGGVLRQFMLSHYVARKTGLLRAPNAGGNLIMKRGDQPLADIIGRIKKGLLVARYSGGAAGANGEFSGVAKNSFLIEDGKIASAVAETMISGNLAGMLNQVAGISSETVEDGSGSLPFMAVNGITISGK